VLNGFFLSPTFHLSIVVFLSIHLLFSPKCEVMTPHVLNVDYFNFSVSYCLAPE
jgi:hypothetical protein